MQIQRIQNYSIQPKNNNQTNRQQKINLTTFSGAPTYSNKGCGFLMALSIATVIGAITAPFVTYNYLSENQKENGKIVNILTSIGTGIATFGIGTIAIFHADDKLDPSNGV